MGFHLGAKGAQNGAMKIGLYGAQVPVARFDPQGSIASMGARPFARRFRW